MVGQYRQQLDNVMKREVSRGEFIKIMGVALLGIIGVTGFLKNLHSSLPARTAAKNRLGPSGYGRSAYGR